MIDLLKDARECADRLVPTVNASVTNTTDLAEHNGIMKGYLEGARDILAQTIKPTFEWQLTLQGWETESK